MKLCKSVNTALKVPWLPSLCMVWIDIEYYLLVALSWGPEQGSNMHSPLIQIYAFPINTDMDRLNKTEHLQYFHICRFIGFQSFLSIYFFTLSVKRTIVYSPKGNHSTTTTENAELEIRRLSPLYCCKVMLKNLINWDQ